MNPHTQRTKQNRFCPLLLTGLILGSLAPVAFAQLPIQESCTDTIQRHVDWLDKGLVGTNGTQTLYAAVTGTMSSHQLPNNTTSSTADSVQFTSSTIFALDKNRNLVFVGTLQASPAFALNPALTAQVTVTPAGAVTIQRLLNNKPFTLQGADSFDATCVGNVLTGYANGTQYTFGLQDTTAPHGGPI